MTDAPKKRVKGLDEYVLLGRSGLRVSPLCLGTMTFGTEWGWGSDAETSKAVMFRYLDAGGNFLDTADMYTGGHSEEMIGQFLKESNRRDETVIATKFTFNARPGDPNAGGNGRKNILRALEGSLRRLQTDYVDLYWLHSWDTLTPVEEVVGTLDALVRAGKVRYVGFSNTPGWYLGQAHTLATLRGLEPVCALQLEFSLVERTIELEHVAAAQQFGLGICPWSPLAGGFLSGKYERSKDGGQGRGRLDVNKNPLFDRFTPRNWDILDALREAAREVGRPPAQVALNWAATRPGMTSTIIGASRLDQLDANLAALEFTLPAEVAAKLEAASRPERGSPYSFFGDAMQQMIRGGVKVLPEPRGYRPR
jgi:aryl-alcohol dehydrogenase-like predicted oxidoreductase